MIDLDIDGNRRSVTALSGGELRAAIERALPDGHLVGALRVDGRALDWEQLDALELERVRSVDVRTARPEQLALASLDETADWIDRIRNVSGAVARDFRLGRDADARARLGDLVDALQVLVGLLQGLRSFLPVKPAQRDAFDRDWGDAEEALHLAVSDLVRDLERGDGVALADHAGYALPHALERFGALVRGARA